MTRRQGRRTLIALALVTAFSGLPGLGIATHALQSGEVFPPASGHAQVIAQGVAALPSEAAWRVVFHSVDPGAVAELPTGSPGFILVDTGGVVVDDDGRSALLAPSEASFQAGPAARLVPVGERPAGLFTIDLVAPDAADDAANGLPVYTSAPFDTPDGERDVDLVRDLLEPGESTTVIGNATPVLVLVTLGAIRAEATDGSSASLRVGEAATFSGDIVLTAEGQAPSTFVAAVIGREAPGSAAAGTPGATPAPESVGSVQVTVYACPPLVEPDQASPGRCLRDPEAAALELAAIDGPTLRDLGPSTERQGLPTWVGLPAGDYALQASVFKEGFDRFFVRGLDGTDDRADEGYGAEETDGYVVPVSDDAVEYALEVFVLATDGDTTPIAESTESPSVIIIETEVPSDTPKPTRTPTPRPAPIATATPRPTESPIVMSTAVARPSRGSVDVRVLGCPDSIETFDPATCVQAVDGFDVRLISETGDSMELAEVTIEDDGTVTLQNLPLGTYLLQQPGLLPGAATYYVPDLPLADDGVGYVVTIGADEPVASVDVFNLPLSSLATSPDADAALDSDQDGILDADETAIFGTDPANADSDLDGIGDGAELAAGTDPLAADGASPVDPTGDSDGDRLSDADEAVLGTDPGSSDTDGDGFFDGDEVNLGADPLDASSVPVG